MARQKEWVWEHYYQDSIKCNSTNFGARCKYCTSTNLARIRDEEKKAFDSGNVDAERHESLLLIDARNATPRTTGKVVVLLNHLLSCIYCPETVKCKAQAAKNIRRGLIDGEGEENAESDEPAGTSTSSLRKRTSDTRLGEMGMKKQKSFTVIAAKGVSYSPEKQMAFENQLLRAVISAGWSFNSINDVEVIKLFHSIAPGLKIPDRTKLSTKILRRGVVALEGEIQKATKNAYGTLQSDVWKDVSRKHLAAFMLSSNRQVFLTHLHDVSSKRRTGELMFTLIEEEKTYLESVGVKLIGVAGDAGGDERKARRLAQEKYPWLLIADCWGHQVPLMLSDYKKKNGIISTVMDEASAVVKWFNNHSFALGLLNKEQNDIYNGKTYTLIIPVQTRWTAHFCSLSRLLEVHKALEVTASKYRDEILDSVGSIAKSKRKARKIIARVKDDLWWDKVLMIKTHIEPLAIAVNVAQGSTTRCDHVLLVLGNLYRVYTQLRIWDRTRVDAEDEDESHPVSSILESIEKRWSKADQDLFIACLWLNPFINRFLINDSTLPVAVLMGIIRRLYLRVFNIIDCPSNLISQIYAYHTREDMFSEEKWPIESLKDALREADGSNDPVRAWKILNTEQPLVQLAIRIFSFVPNSAATERIFSSMGDIKTKKRNRLGVQKLRDIAMVKAEIRKSHTSEGSARVRLKRQFGNAHTTAQPISVQTTSQLDDEDLIREVINEIGERGSESDSLDEDNTVREGTVWDEDEEQTISLTAPYSFSAVMQNFEDVDTDDEDIDDTTPGPLVPATGAVPRVRLFVGQSHPFKIVDIFNWSVEAGWETFWVQGVKNYREEMGFYEDLSRLGGDMGADNSATPSQSAPGTSHNPVEIS